MTQTKRRPLYLAAFSAVAVPLLAASIAYACGALASLTVQPHQGDAGAVVNGFGKGFNSSHGGASSAEPVVVRFGSRTGPVVWSGRPDASGGVQFSFVVPKVDPGQYTLLAMQNNADGQPAPGTPARASFEVTGVAPAPAPVQEALPAEQSATPAPAAAPAPRATAAPRVRVAPAARAATPAAAPAAATPAPVAAPAPVEAPAAVAAPAVPVAPAPAATPAPAPARRSVMVSMAGDSSGSPALAIALVGIGLVLSLGASALVLSGRREQKAPARARR